MRCCEQSLIRSDTPSSVTCKRQAATYSSLYSRISPSGYSPLGNSFDNPIRGGSDCSAFFLFGFFFFFRFLESTSDAAVRNYIDSGGRV